MTRRHYLCCFLVLYIVPSKLKYVSKSYAELWISLLSILHLQRLAYWMLIEYKFDLKGELTQEKKKQLVFMSSEWKLLVLIITRGGTRRLIHSLEFQVHLPWFFLCPFYWISLLCSNVPNNTKKKKKYYYLSQSPKY